MLYRQIHAGFSLVGAGAWLFWALGKANWNRNFSEDFLIIFYSGGVVSILKQM